MLKGHTKNKRQTVAGPLAQPFEAPYHGEGYTLLQTH